jgi:hypothetical protein
LEQIQSIVITGGGLGGDLKPKEVVSMLLDDGEVEEKRIFYFLFFSWVEFA